MDEKVLVFPTPILESIGKFHGFSKDLDRYLPKVLATENLAYLPRSQAETDPSFKQLIPYAVLVAGDRVYCYRRGAKGNESRLRGLLSLGIGGHISREDGEAGNVAYDAGFARELQEEVRIDARYRQRIVGLVHDDSNAVGEVHFGVVHRLDLERPNVVHRDPAITEASFREISEVRSLRDQFETWSIFVIDHLFGSTAR